MKNFNRRSSQVSIVKHLIFIFNEFGRGFFSLNVYQRQPVVQYVKSRRVLTKRSDHVVVF